MYGSFHKDWIHVDSKGLCLLNYDELHQMHFFRSSKVITTDLCLVRALLMIYAILEVCSRTPDSFGVKPF